MRIEYMKEKPLKKLCTLFVCTLYIGTWQIFSQIMYSTYVCTYVFDIKKTVYRMWLTMRIYCKMLK